MIHCYDTMPFCNCLHCLYSVRGEKTYIKEREGGRTGRCTPMLFCCCKKSFVHKAGDLADYGWIKTMTMTSSRGRSGARTRTRTRTRSRGQRAMLGMRKPDQLRVTGTPAPLHLVHSRPPTCHAPIAPIVHIPHQTRSTQQ